MATGDDIYEAYLKTQGELVTLTGKIYVRIANLNIKIAKAKQPPLTGDIYSLEKWESQLEILKDLL